jgi:hypothetical protein
MIPKALATRMMGHLIVRRRNSPRSMLAKSIIKYRLSTRGIGPLPSFIIIGAQRGGTTNLYNLLLGHPDVYPGVVKEAHYFDQHFSRGTAWYRAHFAADCRSSDEPYNRPITGEATPCYLFHPHAARRVAELLPTTKLIVLLRNPVDRAYSHYNLSRAWGHEELSFDEAIACEEARIADDVQHLRDDEWYLGANRARFSYLSRGIYADQLPGWLQRFGSERLLILQSETFFADPGRTLGHVIDFLGLPPKKLDLNRDYPKLSRPPLEKATREQLTSFFQPHNERLFDLLGTEYDWE